MKAQAFVIGLERLTKPSLCEAPADESGGEMMESLEDVGASLVADGQSTEAAEPGQSAFDDPAMSSQTLAALDAAPGDAIADPSPAQGTRAARQVIGLIGVELVRALAGPSPTLADRRHSIDQLVKDAAVMNVCRSDPESEGDTLGVGDNVALGPGAATIGRIGAGLFAPPFCRDGGAVHAGTAPVNGMRPAQAVG